MTDTPTAPDRSLTAQPVTFREQLLESAIRGLAMGVGLGIVTVAFVGVLMFATGNCKP